MSTSKFQGLGARGMWWGLGFGVWGLGARGMRWGVFRVQASGPRTHTEFATLLQETTFAISRIQGTHNLMKS